MLFSGAWGENDSWKKLEAKISSNDPSVIIPSSATIVYSYMSESVKVID
jgi:hypothetical protein